MYDKFRFGRVFGIPYRIWVKTTDFRKSSYQRLSNPSGHSIPVFLVGCGRSGTNMVTSQLAKSWQVDSYNEDHPAAFYNWRLRDLTVITKILESGYTRVKLFKPILDTPLSGKLLEIFHDGKILFVFRHFYDVINSAMKRPDFKWPSRVYNWIKDDFAEFNLVSPPQKTKEFIYSRWSESISPESSIALYWIFYNRLYFDLNLYGDNRVKLINYEKLVQNPTQEIKSICDFLKLCYHPNLSKGVFSSSIRRDQPPKIDRQIQEDCLALWEKLIAV